MRQKREKSRGSAGNNRKTGDSFLEKNRTKEGVIETTSGLQYKILESGLGPTPDEHAKVTIHQRCTLVNGKVIEDTYKENKPDEVSVAEMIEGYREGILLMNKGAKFRLFVPPELAWGKKGTGTKIPPNSVLIFDVKLLDFW